MPLVALACLAATSRITCVPVATASCSVLQPSRVDSCYLGSGTHLTPSSLSKMLPGLIAIARAAARIAVRWFCRTSTGSITRCTRALVAVAARTASSGTATSKAKTGSANTFGVTKVRGAGATPGIAAATWHARARTTAAHDEATGEACGHGHARVARHTTTSNAPTRDAARGSLAQYWGSPHRGHLLPCRCGGLLHDHSRWPPHLRHHFTAFAAPHPPKGVTTE